MKSTVEDFEFKRHDLKSRIRKSLELLYYDSNLLSELRKSYTKEILTENCRFELLKNAIVEIEKFVSQS